MSSGRGGASTAATIATADALTRFTRDVFQRAGMSEVHAATVADVLVWASLRGVDSHGVARIPMYVRLIDDGDLNLAPTIAVQTETVASVLFDADRAAGPIAMTTATRAAVRKAGDAGIGMALVRATTHTAALGYYTLMAAQDGMAAIAVSASTPFMAYHGTRVAGVSTNPISIAVPGGARGPVVLDMSTGVVARGRLVQASKTGQPIPAGWALDRNGNPTTDPREALTLLPQGGAKGSGLSLMIELITSLVVSNPIIAEALEGTDEGGRHRQNGPGARDRPTPLRRSARLPGSGRPADRGPQGAAAGAGRRRGPDAGRAGRSRVSRARRPGHSHPARDRAGAPRRGGPLRRPDVPVTAVARPGSGR